MNIETANRLYELRKKNGYSQEELASKLGISRQAISKWERAEASPDTDNLVELAKLYKISLDELLNLDKSFNNKEEIESVNSVNEDDSSESNTSISKECIKISDDEGSVEIGKDGIIITSEEGEEVHIGYNEINSKERKIIKNGHVYVKRRDESSLHTMIDSIFTPLTLFGSIITYLILGFTLGGVGWASYWVLLLLIPIVPTFIDAVFAKQFTRFFYPLLVAGVYCFLGIRFPNVTYTLFGKEFTGFWHPWWILFITIPIYYVIFGPIDDLIRKNSKNKSDEIIDQDDFIDEEDDD